MKRRTHYCDDNCRCPVHRTPLYYSVKYDTHACQSVDCYYREGYGLTGWPTKRWRDEDRT